MVETHLCMESGVYPLFSISQVSRWSGLMKSKLYWKKALHSEYSFIPYFMINSYLSCTMYSLRTLKSVEFVLNFHYIVQLKINCTSFYGMEEYVQYYHGSALVCYGCWFLDCNFSIVTAFLSYIRLILIFFYWWFNFL